MAPSATVAPMPESIGKSAGNRPLWGCSGGGGGAVVGGVVDTGGSVRLVVVATTVVLAPRTVVLARARGRVVGGAVVSDGEVVGGAVVGDVVGTVGGLVVGGRVVGGGSVEDGTICAAATPDGSGPTTPPADNHAPRLSTNAATRAATARMSAPRPP